mmetsp:Transcript_17505/g.46642  ORF Transcript_17505/g.46642 Transcript_17505/m.46642 type:complete len:687 (-) Transcript_17505:118-2178(-)
MKSTINAVMLLAVIASAGAAQDSPVGKAVQLLSDLQAKIIKEGEGAQKVYAEFTEWCEERSKNVGFEISTGKSQVAELQAAIAQEEATIGSLTAQVEKLAGDIAIDEADLKAATEIRAKEEDSFTAEEKELMEVIDTLRRAIGLIEREMKKGGASMLQQQGANTLAQALTVLVHASMLSTSDASRLTALVQSADEEDDVGAPAASVYESHSGGILDTLTDLLEKAEEQLDAARKKETQDIHAYEMLEQSLKDEIKYGQKELAEAKQGIAAAGSKKASGEGDLDMTSKNLKEDISTLSDLHHTCMTKAEEFESETKSRGEELKALAEAKQALMDNVGGAEDLSYGLNQVSLLQLTRASSGITSSATLVQFEATRLVRDLARKQHSTELAQLASRMGSAIRASSQLGEDPFAKVKGLIQDMIERLENEADQDATKKAFCDTELAETNDKKADKTAEIEKLSVQIDKMSSRSTQLKEEVAALQKALSELAAAQAEMDKIRAEEKELYGKNKADMEQGLEGVKLALKILREYYAKEDKAHAAAEGAGTSIIGLLEVVESDFTKGLAEMTADEQSAQASYEAQTKENDIEKTMKEQDVKYKTKESTELDKTTAETTSDRSGVQAELDAVLEYLKKMEEQCIAKAETFASRKARFEAEIAGLKEALRVLESETAFMQRGTSSKLLRGVRRHI